MGIAISVPYPSWALNRFGNGNDVLIFELNNAFLCHRHYSNQSY
jgi:hypothetical protein